MENNEEKKPKITDPEWHDYVMGHFQEEELFQGYPKADGLRRVAELLLGPIIRSESYVRQSPRLSHGGVMDVAVAEHTIEINDLQINEKRIITDAADVWFGNIDPLFSKFPTAVAATRAEGRALRKALRLKTVAAEELMDISSFDINTKGKITDTQINFVNILCHRNEINVMKFVNSGSKKYNNIEEVGFETAAKMVSHLTDLQSSGAIPENLKGYDPNWRKKT